MSRILALTVLLIGTHALAKQGFETVPPTEAKGKPTPFTLRIKGYDGSTNGVLTVDVKNTGTAPATFTAHGLYFVPAVDPDKAPQRLGAVGTIAVSGEAGLERREELTLAPGQTVRARLDVYCIDSHRASPTSSTPFRIGKDRLPRQLVQTIEQDAKAAAGSNGGYSSPAAKSVIQKEVWKNRDREWIKLDGESRQEAAK